MKQLTLRGFDPELERRLRQLAKSEGLSLSQAALRMMRKGAGLADAKAQDEVIGNALDGFFGTWTDKQARELQAATEVFEEIDPELWK